MSSSSKALTLVELVDKIVSVITSDGRVLIGSLKGYDQMTNIILEASFSITHIIHSIYE